VVYSLNYRVKAYNLAEISTQQMEVTCSFEMLLNFYQNIWSDIAKDCIPHTCRISLLSVIMYGTVDSRSMEN